MKIFYYQNNTKKENAVSIVLTFLNISSFSNKEDNVNVFLYISKLITESYTSI